MRSLGITRRHLPCGRCSVPPIPGCDNCGWTFGQLQWDLRQRPDARQFLLDLRSGSFTRSRPSRWAARPIGSGRSRSVRRIMSGCSGETPCSHRVLPESAAAVRTGKRTGEVAGALQRGSKKSHDGESLTPAAHNPVLAFSGPTAYCWRTQAMMCDYGNLRPVCLRIVREPWEVSVRPALGKG